MRTVLLDTSGLFAAAQAGSERHAQDRSAYEQLLRGPDRLVVTDLVLAELHALALARAGPAVALDLAARLASSGRVELVVVGRDRLDAALELLAGRPGRRYSLADAASFTVMWELGATAAFALDADFAAEGFELIPPAA